MGRQAATFGVVSVGGEGAGQGEAEEDLEEAEGNQRPRTFLPIRSIPQPVSSLKPSSPGAILSGIQTISAAGTMGLRPTVPSSALFLRSRETGREIDALDGDDVLIRKGFPHSLLGLAVPAQIATVCAGVAMIEVMNLSRSKLTVGLKVILTHAEPSTHIATVNAVSASPSQTRPVPFPLSPPCPRLSAQVGGARTSIPPNPGGKSTSKEGVKGEREQTDLPPVDLSAVPEEWKPQYLELLGEFSDI
uniref:Uncharacterized protein n=1 Tax=Chromera velia CCMP2878 TaxID=1169474 RepID=A0A0G4HGA6_9ALVE|eukprot:Cvel_27327.t1-p1 / transcript=Cvel_27327.t1 / gene=Cvel_27327 / organism=Chromera_velia_CCMP2878 / gene_product=hypothetical protein / transcript_product=hypothetical protein / location=Cvel_scaffold3390:6859-8234(+) / protein_length=246 / sequence_SO=supercontig / SO=protein_coding / is_pseudo=false